LTKDTANEICFKVDGIVCVILIINEKPHEDIISIFSALQNHLAPKIDRGIKYRFGWINSNTQNQFIYGIGLEKGDNLKMILVNPGSRKRYYIMDKELNEENMKNVFDRLVGGELRFKNFIKNIIPELD
jgi:polyribonucleotide nucleotidyltransferase